MANIRKTFNFRNGVQVDEDNLIVNPLGLVGIGTSVPTEILDVRGTAKIVGLVTANQIFTNSLTVGLTTDGNLGVATISSANIGVATVLTKLTAANLSISSGIVSVTSGVVTFYGDGSGLYNIPTSQWVDVDAGLGFTSIYAAGNVGVGTTDPRFTFQIGGNNVVGNFQNGVGINSTGDIIATGIISATTLRGNGALISGINASNISSGTLDNARLPSNINISGIATFNGNVFVSSGSSVTAPEYYGYAREVSTVKSAYFGNTVEIENTGVGNGLQLTNGASLTITTGNATIGGSSTITGSLTVGGSSTITGSLTVGFITAITSFIGVSTANSLRVKNIRLGVSGNNEIDTTSGNLILNSYSGNTVIDDNLSVTGISTLSGEVTVDTGIIPDASVGAYLGKSGKEFSEAYIDTITIGVNDGKITTTSGNLILDSNSGIVTAAQNLVVNGSTISYGGLSVGGNISPTVDLNTDLGSSGYRLKRGYISYIEVGVGASNKINSTNSTDLLLDSGSGTTFIDDNLKVSGIGTFTGVLNVNSDIVPGTNNAVKLGTSTLKFSEAYIDNITIGAASSTTINTTFGDLILSANSGVTTVSNSLNVGGTFEVYQSTTLNSLTVQNLSTLNGNVNIGGTLTVSQNFTSSQLSTLDSLYVQNQSNFNDNVSFAGTVTVSGPLINVGGIGINAPSPAGPFQVGTENDFYSSIVAIASTIGITTTIIAGIETSGITVGLQILEVQDLIASGTVVTSIGSSQVGIGTTTLNNVQVDDYSLTFGNYYNDRTFAINSTKSVGIGTINPTAKLDVIGDVKVGVDTSAGVILTSANGTKYRLIVSNAGVLSTVLVP